MGAIFSKGSDYPKLTSYIQQLRLDYAAKLLVEQPDKNIVQIAADSGFSSSTYFSNCFRHHFGLNPTIFVGMHCREGRKKSLYSLSILSKSILILSFFLKSCPNTV